VCVLDDDDDDDAWGFFSDIYLSFSCFLLQRESKKKISLSLSPFFVFLFFFGPSRSCRFGLSFSQQPIKTTTPPGPAGQDASEGGFLWGDFYRSERELTHSSESSTNNILHFAFETRRAFQHTKKKVNTRSRSRGTFCLDFLLLLLLPRSLSRSFSLSSIWRASSVKARLCDCDDFHILCRLRLIIPPPRVQSVLK
jgi:hypothetical protein